MSLYKYLFFLKYFSKHRGIFENLLEIWFLTAILVLSNEILGQVNNKLCHNSPVVGDIVLIIIFHKKKQLICEWSNGK